MRTIIFNNKPIISSSYSVAGPKESKGKLSKYIDFKLADDTFDEKTFEKAETKILLTALKGALEKCNFPERNLDLIIAGDLLNQIISATFASRNFNSGYLGVYNACATFTESLIVGATFIDGGYLNNVLCGTSSHFSTAERQYRYPLELGSVRPPQAQWTVTGAGACLLSNVGKGPKIISATIGNIVDYGVTDANNMGAAMAPAAAETILRHFKDLNLSPEYYDLIVTGDLGALGSRIVKSLLWEKGYNVEKQHVDCGELIYNINEFEYQGGSGAGCSSLVFSSYLMDKLLKKQYKRILLVATGALLSSLSTQQGESIPGIAHLVALES